MAVNEIDLMSRKITTYSTDINKIPTETINVIYMNIRSCRNKLDLIESFIASLKISLHAIVFTETWLYSEEIFNIYGYQSFHCTRDCDRGGGVSIFVKDGISAHVLFAKHLDVSNFLVVELPDFSIKLTGIYNPGRNLTQFISDIDNTTTSFPASITFGDFNMNLLDLADLHVSEYRSTIEGNGYLILNRLDESYATRESNTIKTMIDHVFTDLCKYSYNFTLLDSDADLSDHKTIVLSVGHITEKVQRKTTKTVLQYERIDENSLVVAHHNNFNDMIVQYQEVIQENTKVINTRKKQTPKKPYITQEILKLIKLKRNIYFASKRNQALLTDYKRARNELANKIKNAKKNYTDGQLNASLHNPKALWGHINELAFNKHNVVSEKSYQIEIDGILNTDETTLSETFNNYYVSVCETIVQDWNFESLHPFDENENCNTRFSFTPTSENLISKYIDNLNANSSTGLDGISAKFLKRYKNIYLSKYTELVNSCIETSTFPDVFKQAKVIPLFKAGNKTHLKNYRPVSILNVSSKPMERVLYDQILEYCTYNHILHKNQFGFVPKSNTMTAVANLTNDIITGIGQGKEVSCVFIDVKKAFDCVHHKLLLVKLQKVGFSEKATSLVESYFQNRTQKVKINSTLSSPLSIKHGVPQGSILGPLMFNLYLNDIFELPLKGKLQLYADDATILYIVKDLAILKSYTEHDIRLLLEYFNRNHMALNLEKNKLYYIQTARKFT